MGIFSCCVRCSGWLLGCLVLVIQYVCGIIVGVFHVVNWLLKCSEWLLGSGYSLCLCNSYGRFPFCRLVAKVFWVVVRVRSNSMFVKVLWLFFHVVSWLLRCSGWLLAFGYRIWL